MRKTKEEALQTRCNLLKAALTVFYQRGVVRASLDEIAKTAGVTRGALYWHFKNKEDLFDALFQVHFSGIEHQLDQALQDKQSGDPLLLLQDGILKHFQRLSQDAHLKKFSTILYLRCEQTDENQNIVNLIQKYHQAWDEHLLAIFEQSKQQGILPANLNSQLALVSLTSMLSGLTAKWLSTLEPFDLQEYAPNLIKIYFDNLKNSPFLREST
ncbi:MAG: Transcription repressor of multidrug efflux pump acrAB operon, TetR (AcrR) family [Burkholderiaceae bacterium]|nr:Transcription repressor of multidrug efflux pump acrAB operon, TetR (AcrR) family [Burkholderiaceae bacterium]